jgi:ACGX-repeat protein
MSKLNLLGPWKGGPEKFFAGNSAQSFMKTGPAAMAAGASCGSSCGAGDGAGDGGDKKEEKPKPGACGASCGAGDDGKKKERPKPKPEGLDGETIYDGCNCGIGHLTILPNGDVYACRRMESLAGNVFTDRLADVFLGEKMDVYRAFEKFEKCSQCELLRFCRGCPAVAYSCTHNSYSGDPQCWKKIPA